MLNATRSACVFLVVLSGLSAQVVYTENNDPTLGTSNTIPWGQANGYTSLHAYSAANLLAAGVCAGAVLTDLAVAPSSGTTGTYLAPQARLEIGHLAASPPILNNWTSHFSSSVVAHDLTSGPFTFPWTLNTWTSLPGVGAAGLVWDGVSDIGILYTSAAATTGTFSARRTGSSIRHLVSVFNATTQAGSADVAAMKIRTTWAGGTTLYQVNQPVASLDVNGVQGAPCGRANPRVCLSAVANVNVASTLLGAGWELMYAASDNLVPLGAGGTPLASGQILNMNLGSPNLTFVNALSFPPFPGNFSIPLTLPILLNVASQFLVLDPASADGFSLSQGVDLTFTDVTSVPPPVGNDAFIAVPFSTLSCLPTTTFSFYGTSYTQMFVSTNGREMFGTSGSASGVPSVTSAQATTGTIGAWCNLNPMLGGNIAITGNLAGIVRVEYQAVPYQSLAAVTNTFAIELDLLNGTIFLDGLTGIQASAPAGNLFLGVSRGPGGTSPATPTSFLNPSGTTLNANDMVYEFGPTGTLAAGRATLFFFPNIFSNYDWF